MTTAGKLLTVILIAGAFTGIGYLVFGGKKSDDDDGAPLTDKEIEDLKSGPTDQNKKTVDSLKDSLGGADTAKLQELLKKNKDKWTAKEKDFFETLKAKLSKQKPSKTDPVTITSLDEKKKVVHFKVGHKKYKYEWSKGAGMIVPLLDADLNVQFLPDRNKIVFNIGDTIKKEVPLTA
jgi:hypothetical protein